jgi:multicomponent Na+:H+ antiporter subunit B
VVAGFAGVVFLSDVPWPEAARDYLAANGVEESGAKNLVSAIYLGFRAFDTLGETIVLLMAISGTIGILALAGAIAKRGHSTPHTGSDRAERTGETESALFSLPQEKRKSNLWRTNLIEEVTAKIAPVVLLFGFYLMLYGHLSPGGGFQGGVVIASGIAFIGLGKSVGFSPRIVRAEMLERFETIAFFLLVSASISGIFVGRGFFGNPLSDIISINAGFIVVLNMIIGLKVGAGIGLVCITLLGRAVE